MYFARLPARALVCALLAVSLALACGGRDRAESGLVVAITVMDGAALHAIDESINERGEVPANARATALKLQTVTSLTDWPSGLEMDARALERVFAELAAALEGDHPDLAKAGAAAERAHEAQHDFSEKVWDYLREKAGVQGAEAAHDD
jgi:hypothetical protein